MLYATGLIRGIVFAVTVAMATALTSQSAMAEDINLRFSWKLKGEYGFFYLGQEKELYKDAGLNVTFGEGAGAQAALAAVIQGQEDLAVVPGIFAITAIQKGMPVKIIALYQPAAPVVLVSHPENPVVKPTDLEGKSVASSIGETSTAYMDVFCVRNNIDCKKVNKIQMDSQTRIPQFVQKKVDAVGMYRTSDLPVLLDKVSEGYAVLDLVEFGLTVPGLAVVASVDGIEKRSDALRSFLSVTSKSIEMARNDPAATTAALKTIWQAGPSDEIVRAQIEATSVSIPPATDHPLGWIDEKSIANALELIGSIDDIGEPKPLTSFFTNELLTQ